MPSTRPKPLQVVQAPSGELNEKSAGVGRSSFSPQTSQVSARPKWRRSPLGELHHQLAAGQGVGLLDHLGEPAAAGFIGAEAAERQGQRVERLEPALGRAHLFDLAALAEAAEVALADQLLELDVGA